MEPKPLGKSEDENDTSYRHKDGRDAGTFRATKRTFFADAETEEEVRDAQESVFPFYISLPETLEFLSLH
ncbi:MAG: hypothetical protein IAF94_14550 [Pirellulaceae bacterium]|nr:hypothetical protein [Pirellulaceae bacterium]